MIRSSLLLVIFLALAMPLPAEPRAPVRDTATLALFHFDQLPVRNDGLVPIALEGGTPGLVEGRFGKALDARAGEPVLFRLPIAAQPKTTLTVECWVKLVGESEERLQRIVGRSSNFGFYSTRGGRLTWFVMAKEWKSVPGKLEVGKWTHLAGTFDGKKMQLYIDGKLAGEAENPGELRQGPGDFFL
ncbi:MAG: LamG domain-containing protein, partial [Victivallales bacterium]|nr:LamG domain-containing protein [Victivallales bacterium]